MKEDADIVFSNALAIHRNGPNRLHQEKHLHEYYQTSMVSALMQGVLEGNVSVGSLLDHGDIGIGTFNGLDGEMIVLDGEIYQTRGKGDATRAGSETKTPYAAVTFFVPDVEMEIASPLAKEPFEARLEDSEGSKNLFYAVRIDGVFPYVKIRNVVRQTPPYQSLLDVVVDQVVNEFRDVKGTMVGFRCPDYASGIGVPGYHLHFIDEDRANGGHVLDYTVGPASVALDQTAVLHLELPESQTFSDADIAVGSSADDIRKAES